MDEDIVKKWPASKLRGWLTFLHAKNDVESEAYERAKKAASSPGTKYF